MNPRTFELTFADGTRRRVTCVFDLDRHTGVYVREYLAEIALRRRIFGERPPELVTLEEIEEIAVPIVNPKKRKGALI